jgi:hypothetical protein
LTEDQWRNASLGERVCHLARADVNRGVREVPRGSNCGPVVSEMLRLAGIFSPAAWCGAAVYCWVIAAGGDRRKLPRFPASTYWWWRWARDSGRLADQPARGRLFVWNGRAGGHIGCCMDGANPTRTIEGNTDDQGSREGWKVAERMRQRSFLQGFPRWGFILIGDDLFEE